MQGHSRWKIGSVFGIIESMKFVAEAQKRGFI